MIITDLTDKELYEKSREIGSQVLKYRNQFLGLLPEVHRRQLYRKHKMASIYEFAAKLAGITNETVDKVLRLDEKLEDLPILRDQLTTGKVGWAKLNVIAPIVKPETENLWAEKVVTMSKSALETIKHDIILSQAEAKTVYPGVENSDEKEASLPLHEAQFRRFSMDLSEENIQQLQVLKVKLEKEKKILTWNEAITEILKRMNEQPQPKTQRKTSIRKPSETITRHIPVETVRRVVTERNGICSTLNCRKPATVIHHQIPFALKQEHLNLEPLCDTHHEIRHHGVNHEADIVQQLQFEDRSPMNEINQKFQKFKIKH